MTPRLVPPLLAELMQAERVAYRRPIQAAERLGDVLPSIALRAVAAHANEALDELPKLAKVRGIPLAAPGQLAADALAAVRRLLVDRLVDHERAYRATLLEMRRGLDLVRTLRAAADDEGDDDLAAFCDRWLPVRERLVSGVAAELPWLARHPAFGRMHPVPAFGL